MRPHRNHGLTDAERLKQCESKFRYSDELTVRAAGMISLEQHPSGYTKLYAYRCGACLGWHLTKSKHYDREPIMLQEPERLAA